VAEEDIMSTETPLYDDDFYRWTQYQAALLRAGKWQELDYANLAEEIESLGKWDKRDLEQRLEGLLIHLLTWWAKPEDRCGRWQSTIHTQRYELELLLRDSPSLEAQVPVLLTQVYSHAREVVLEDTRLYTLPESCPFTPDQVLSADFWPENATL
jgi:hypothetical protein